jgi:hypothetical protein
VAVLAKQAREQATQTRVVLDEKQVHRALIARLSEGLMRKLGRARLTEQALMRQNQGSPESRTTRVEPNPLPRSLRTETNRWRSGSACVQDPWSAVRKQE